MRSLLEKAIVHLLNEEQDKAEALFHKFMVEKARRIHESLRSGEAVLEEGWDDEISSEEYMTDNDLDSVEDHDGEAAPEAAADDLGDDMGVDAAADDADIAADDADADAEIADDDAEAADDMDAGEADEPEAVEDRLADIEDQIEKLTADFDQMMGELDSEPGEDGLDEPADGDDEFDGLGDDAIGDDADAMGGDDTMAGDDLGGGMGDGDGMGGDDAMADRMEDDVTDDDAMADDDHMAEGKVPPQFMKHIKKKAGKKKDTKEAVEEEDEDDNLDDITESVMAELERISVTMEDGKEVADGKKITTNDKSALVQTSIASRGEVKPVTIKGPNHTGYERETPPTSKDYKPKKNTVRGKADGVLKSVPDKGDKSALLNKDFAGSSKS